MPEEKNKVDDVFGINRDLPMNYQERSSADKVLVTSLTRDKHIVIYGSSKQGKTSLRKHCLNQEDYITVHCSNKWQLSDLNSAILKKAGYELKLSDTKATSGKYKIFAKIKASFLGSAAEGGAESERKTKREEVTAPIELDPDDVNDIIAALDSIKFNKFLVLEDFHYLPVETQKDFSVALKAYHENSGYCFIIIGVWLEENRLSVYNGDLTGRVFSINADKWERAELSAVISSGEALLNITFHKKFIDNLLDSCFKNVFIVQEACHRCCTIENFFQTQDEHFTIGSSQDAREIVKDVVNQQTGRFNSFLTQFADGFQPTKLEMHKWLLYAILTSDISELDKGIRQASIRKTLQNIHPEGKELNPGNVTQALQAVAALQIKKDIKPNILDYDQTNTRLQVVDRSFMIWLENQNRNDLLELIGLPTD
ncbi:ATP-binding protein [Candidatus Electrothrix aarhusensis]